MLLANIISEAAISIAGASLILGAAWGSACTWTHFHNRYYKRAWYPVPTAPKLWHHVKPHACDPNGIIGPSYGVISQPSNINNDPDVERNWLESCIWNASNKGYVSLLFYEHEISPENERYFQRKGYCVEQTWIQGGMTSIDWYPRDSEYDRIMNGKPTDRFTEEQDLDPKMN